MIDNVSFWVMFACYWIMVILYSVKERQLKDQLAQEQKRYESLVKLLEKERQS